VTPMTESELNAIRARLDAATPGPWRVSTRGYDVVAGEQENRTRVCASPNNLSLPEGWERWMNNAELIANAPSDLAALLARVDSLDAENAQLRPLLDKLQDSDLALEAARRERARCVGLLRLRESTNRRMAQAAREAGHVSGIRPATVESLEDEADALAEAVTLLLEDAP